MHLRVPATSLGAPITYLGALRNCLGEPATSLGVPATSLVALRITVEQSAKSIIFFGNAAGAPGNYSHYVLFNNC